MESIRRQHRVREKLTNCRFVDFLSSFRTFPAVAAADPAAGDDVAEDAAAVCDEF